VWYSPKAIANILSLYDVSRRCRVEFDSKEGNRFIVTKQDGKENVFRVSANGLYYYDTQAARNNEHAAVLVTTVNENKTRYTKAEVDQADIARALQQKLGHVSTADFVHIVNNNLLPNCPVTKRDIMAAEDIYGKDLGILKGKTVRRGPPRVDTNNKYTPLSAAVHERYQEVTLCADVMYVNGIAFFVSVSRKIKFGTIEELESQSQARLLKAFQDIARIYHHSGFRIRHALMDGQFGCLEGDLMGMQVLLNKTGNDEHVGDIERYIRTVKERMRCRYNTLPFKKVPGRMVIPSPLRRRLVWVSKGEGRWKGQRFSI
jgi:hypothetical protein